MGHVTGAEHGRKHVNYGLAKPNTKESRQERKSREREETWVLRDQLANLEASIPQRVEEAVAERVDEAVAEKLDDAVANKVNELMPTVVQSVVNYFASG